MELYIKIDLSLEKAAEVIGKTALPDYRYHIRDGLNSGGGDYINFHKDGSTILLVCNDAEHSEVFVESRKAFSYYCYVREGSNEVLKDMHSSLTNNGYESELSNDA